MWETPTSVKELSSPRDSVHNLSGATGDTRESGDGETFGFAPCGPGCRRC